MEQARAAFAQLKRSFTTVPILRHPDPDLPFIVKVDASSCRIEAVLSQHRRNPGKVYPSAYFSLKLTPLHPRVLRWVYEAPSSGHPGIRHTTTLICNRFWWPSLSQDVEEYVESCATCAKSRMSCQLPTGLLELLPIPRWPSSHMAVDFIIDLPDSGGYSMILVEIDWFSKACWLVPLKGLPTAMETATALFKQVFHTYGIPEDSEYAQNSLTHLSTGPTPIQCILDYQPPLFSWSGEPSDMPAVDVWAHHSQEVWESAHVHLQWAIQWQRIKVDHHSPRFIGPFRIIRQINLVMYRLLLPSSYRISPSFHVSLLKPAHPWHNNLPTCSEPPPPLDINGARAYRVNTLLNSWCHRNRLRYLVDWEGHSPEECSWVNANDILDPSLVEKFHCLHPNRRCNATGSLFGTFVAILPSLHFPQLLVLGLSALLLPLTTHASTLLLLKQMNCDHARHSALLYSGSTNTAWKIKVQHFPY
ncbi:hypothetical protein QTP70_002622 [Hemibagrus guttatus]|uniref:Gypsy retrotransposon integrase-like protein 1 n=1 Tax=Hemibagrus guttatus TaxID=175788 RepID=A0AAE0QZ27_9TELE|nr:hypothetical protein QTP70_002622 [Hemibagrus guttatus]